MELLQQTELCCQLLSFCVGIFEVGSRLLELLLQFLCFISGLLCLGLGVAEQGPCGVVTLLLLLLQLGNFLELALQVMLEIVPFMLGVEDLLVFSGHPRALLPHLLHGVHRLLVSLVELGVFD